MRDRQLELVHDEGLPHVPLEQLDLYGRVVRHSEVPHLAGALQLVERPGHLLGLDERVGAVQQQDVDVVGRQG